jgi:membrane-associated phospholipid phosphatase
MRAIVAANACPVNAVEAPVTAQPPKRVRDYRVWAGIVVLAAASAIFTTIAFLVQTKDPILAQDLQVLTWLHTHGNPVFTGFLLAVSTLHSPTGVGIFTVLVAIALARAHKYRWIATLAISVGGGMILNTALKFAFHRGRPVWEDPIISIPTPSFPSGHAAGSTLFYGFLCIYIVSHVESLGLRIAAVAASVFMVLLVCFSRMYLGVHYPSDVLAGISASTAWLVVSVASVREYVKRHAPGGA